MMSLSGSSGRAIERAPFTATQWQELEHQALIYKYMVSGVPVPPELIFSIRRSLDTSLVSRLLPHQSIGWGCYQMGYGRKPDPEPGRCRRTDGKKWRCSREAYPDSKYCEKHMHRGRNRARKSLDHQNQTTTQTLTSSSSTSSASASSSSSMDAYTNTANRFNGGNSRSYFNNHSLHDYPYNPSSSSTKQPLDHVSALSLHHHNTSHFNVLTSPTDHNKDFRYFQGIGERTFFPEASRNFQDSPYQHHHHHQPLATVLNDPYNQCTDKVHHTYSSSSHHHHHQHHRQEEEEEEQQQQCFVLGADMFNKSTRTALGNTSKSQEEEIEKDSSESKKSLHHFFGEDWTQNKNSSDSWLDLSSSHSRLNTGS